MDFFAQNFQIGTLLTKKVYKIPEFQREYSWEKEELEAFWEDLWSKESNDLFFGTIVLVGNNFNDEIGPFSVIDGQQRLTTFLLLINRIVNKFSELQELELALALSSRLKFKDDNAVEYLTLENENAHSFFQKILFHNIETEDKNIEAQKLLYAKSFFEDKITLFNKEDLIKIRDIILKINIIVVVQSDEEKAFEIFETLNFRGMDLSVLDLVKNFIVRNYPKNIGIDDPRETWKLLLQNIKDDKKNFFNRYWASRFKKVSDPKLYKEFKLETKSYTQDMAKKFLNDLKNFSDVYKDVISPFNSSWIKYCPHDRKDSLNIKSSIESLSKFQVRVHYSFLIVALELSKNKRISQNDLMLSVNLLEKFHFIFNAVCSKRPSGMDSRYSVYAVRLQNSPSSFNKIFSELKNELKVKLPTEEEFVQNFLKLNFENNKSTILYLFRVLEKKYLPGNNVDFSEESLDHVTPQSSKENWVHSVGNIILLEKSLNHEKGKLLLDDSIKILEKTSFASTKNFIDGYVSPWTEEKSIKRGEMVARELYAYIVKTIF